MQSRCLEDWNHKDQLHRNVSFLTYGELKNSGLNVIEPVKIPEISSGVYFLLQQDRVVYVGQATCSAFERIGCHSRTKKFDSFSYIPLTGDQDWFNMVEAYFILLCEPEYNLALPGNIRYLSEAAIRKKYRCDSWILKRFIRDKNIKPINKSLRIGVYYDLMEFLDNGFIEVCKGTKK